MASPAHAAVPDLGSSAVTVFDSILDAAVDVQWLDDEHLVVVAPRRPPEQEGVDDDELARRPRVITALDYRFNARNRIHDRQRNIAIIDLATGGRVAYVDLARSPKPRLHRRRARPRWHEHPGHPSRMTTTSSPAPPASGC
ncbi:MAG: hypothetical protein R2710_23480 [Acidimicrobiales bacterium]